MPVAQAKPSAPSDDKRWRIVETRMRRLGNRPDALIEALHPPRRRSATSTTTRCATSATA